MNVKMAVVAPMPRASDRITVTVKAGFSDEVAPSGFLEERL
ncbi:MAG TPA: hypothetical protein VMT86_17195 [Bryobacteraceae bacterium]|nr:hypothetical protein [Bryobacteraceae bacterium]